MTDTAVIDAMKVVVAAIHEDPAYRESWQASIAMACYDTFANAGYKFPEMHKLCNDGATHFLAMLTGDYKVWFRVEEDR